MQVIKFYKNTMKMFELSTFYLLILTPFYALPFSLVEYNCLKCKPLYLSSFNNGGFQQPSTKKDAFESARNSKVKMPCIILVNPFLDANIGSVSRSMLNFGLTELRLVDPNCDHLSENSRALASGSYEILENAKVFKSLSECLSDLDRVYATSVRPRHMSQLVYTPNKASKEIVTSNQLQSSATVGIMFGTERSGLTNEQLAMADSLIAIPTFKHFSSLNLAQAVNIIGYELWVQALDVEENLPPEVWLHPKDGERMARKPEVESFLARLEASLVDKNYQTDEHRRELVFRSIRNIFKRTPLTSKDVRLLHGVITSLSMPPRGASDGNLEDYEI